MKIRYLDPPATEAEIAEMRKQIANLFEIDQAGLTEKYLKDILKIRTPAMNKGKVYDLSVLFGLCSYYRKIAPYALPNGHLAGVTRAVIEKHRGEPVDWYSFCGIDKPRD